MPACFSHVDDVLLFLKHPLMPQTLNISSIWSSPRVATITRMVSMLIGLKFKKAEQHQDSPPVHYYTSRPSRFVTFNINGPLLDTK